MQGEVGSGSSRFARSPTTPLPSPPLPSQGRERELAASAAPTRACKKTRPVFTGPPVVADARRQTLLPSSRDTTARHRKTTKRTHAMTLDTPDTPDNPNPKNGRA